VPRRTQRRDTPLSYLLYYDLPCGLRPHTIVVEVLTRGIERERLSRQKHTTVERVLKERIRTMIIRAARWIDERHRRSETALLFIPTDVATCRRNRWAQLPWR
jgi:hypothetical protein